MVISELALFGPNTDRFQVLLVPLAYTIVSAAPELQPALLIIIRVNVITLITKL